MPYDLAGNPLAINDDIRMMVFTFQDPSDVAVGCKSASAYMVNILPSDINTKFAKIYSYDAYGSTMFINTVVSSS